VVARIFDRDHKQEIVREQRGLGRDAERLAVSERTSLRRGVAER
jgi:hypothetical protein